MPKICFFVFDRYGTDCEVIIFHFSNLPISFGAVWGSMLGGHWCFLVLFGVSCLGSCLSSSKSFSAKHFAGHPAHPKLSLSSGRNLKLTPPLPVGGLCMDSVLKQWFRPSGGVKFVLRPNFDPSPTQLRPNSDRSPTQVRPNPTPTEVRPKSDRNESKPSRTQPVSNPSPMRAEPERSYIEPTTSKNWFLQDFSEFIWNYMNSCWANLQFDPSLPVGFWS